MNEQENSRSGLQKAVDLAHAARAARRILQAATAAVCKAPLLRLSKKAFHFS